MKYFYLLFLTAISATAQINFEPGYYINNNGTKISGLIRNVDWSDNPVAIDYKENESKLPVTLKSGDLKEFGIGESVVFRRFDVNVDFSTRDIEWLSTNKNPEWQTETALLKVITSGKLILYEYNDHNFKRFFVADSPVATPEQLIFKEYRTADKIGYNNSFRQQLFSKMASSGLVESDFAKLSYNKKDLVGIFNKYNGVNPQDASTLEREGDFNIRILAGVMMGSMEVNDGDPLFGFTADLGQKTIPVVGAEFEYVLPINKNKWGILVGANYQSYKGNARQSPTRTIEANYNFIEIPVGLRHYFFASDKLAIFVNVGYNAALSGDSEITYHSSAPGGIDSKFSISRSSSLMAGAGVKYGGFAAELRILTKRDILDNIYLDATFKSVGVLFSYKII